jgi:hypothetical protein
VPLTDKEKTMDAQGLITLLKQIHDELDTAVRLVGFIRKR